MPNVPPIRSKVPKGQTPKTTPAETERGAATDPAALSPPIGTPQWGNQSSSTPSEDLAIAVKLARYVIHQEDDGLGGKGVDLYLGYLASSPFSLRSNVITVGGAATQSVSGAVGGTTPVSGGLQKGNGQGPKNTHIVNQHLFTAKIGTHTPFAADVRMLEADDSTSEIVAAYAVGRERPVDSRDPVPMLDATQIAAYFAGPVEAIVNILKTSNSDDDYGHWQLSFSQENGQVRLSAYAKDERCSVVQSSMTAPCEVTLKYLDDDNDIEAVLSVSLF